MKEGMPLLDDWNPDWGRFDGGAHNSAPVGPREEVERLMRELGLI